MRVRYARTPNLYPRQNGPFWEHCFREEDVRPELARANAEIDRLHKRLWEKRKHVVMFVIASQWVTARQYMGIGACERHAARYEKVRLMEYKP